MIRTGKTAVIAFLIGGAVVSVWSSGLRAQPWVSFGTHSLSGSYASIGTAGTRDSVAVGVVDFDGRGGVTRRVRINAAGPGNERRLLDLTSVGEYEVADDGQGVIAFTNTLANGDVSEVTFDFVITKTGWTWPGGGFTADEIYAIQREPGVTASPVTELMTRRVR